MCTQTELIPPGASREAAKHLVGSGHFGSIVPCPARVADVQDPAAGSNSDSASGLAVAVDGAGVGGQPSSDSDEAVPEAADDPYGPLSKHDRDRRAEAVSTSAQAFQQEL